MDHVQQTRTVIRDAFGIDVSDSFLKRLRLEFNRFRRAKCAEEDLLQVFLLELFSELRSDRGDAFDEQLLTKVLWRVSKRLSRDLEKTQGHHELRTDPVDRSTPALSTESREALEHAVGQLSIEDAMLANLLIEGRTIREVSQILGIPASTAYRKARQVRELLRQSIGEEST
jgi:DNA-directed RNA polymerase specialized sigma24 family protein